MKDSSEINDFSLYYIWGNVTTTNLILHFQMVYNNEEFLLKIFFEWPTVFF